MLVILEGVDGTFKTTVGKALSDLLNLPLVQGSSFESALLPNDKLFTWYLDRAVETKSGAILDRSIYSNLVYADIYKDYSILSEGQAYLIEELVEHFHGKMVLVIYLFADSYIIAERLSERGDKYVKEDKIPVLLRKYEEVLKEYCMVPYLIRVDTSSKHSRDCCQVILGYLNFMYWMNRKDDNVDRKD